MRASKEVSRTDDPERAAGKREEISNLQKKAKRDANAYDEIDKISSYDEAVDYVLNDRRG